MIAEINPKLGLCIHLDTILLTNESRLTSDSSSHVRRSVDLNLSLCIHLKLSQHIGRCEPIELKQTKVS